MAIRILALLVLVVPFGCGSAVTKGTITGKVTAAGRDVKGGSITFLPPEVDALPLTFMLKDDGTYEATDIPYGELKIGVSLPELGVTMTSAATAKERMGELERTGQPIPRELMAAASGVGGRKASPTGLEKYSDPFSSGFTVVLDTPTKVHNVDLR